MLSYMFDMICDGSYALFRCRENPFTYLMNNLGLYRHSTRCTLFLRKLSDLDHFCQNIKRDLQQVASVCPSLCI